MGVTPTKTGKMREDEYWLIKALPTQTYYDRRRECEVEPVTDQKVNYVRPNEFLSSPVLLTAY